MPFAWFWAELERLKAEGVPEPDSIAIPFDGQEKRDMSYAQGVDPNTEVSRTSGFQKVLADVVRRQASVVIPDVANVDEPTLHERMTVAGTDLVARLGVRLVGTHSEVLGVENVPLTWWDHLKSVIRTRARNSRYLDGTQVARLFVKTRSIATLTRVERLCPHHATRRHSDHVEFLVPSGGGAR